MITWPYQPVGLPSDRSSGGYTWTTTPREPAPTGVWFVYEDDYTPDWVGLYLDELEARRKADEYTWGRVKFVEFGEVGL